MVAQRQRFKVRLPYVVEVEVTVADPDVFERVTGPGGDVWREALYPLHSRDDVLTMLADNCARMGVESASRLDGWADMSQGAAVMKRRTDDADMELVGAEADGGHELVGVEIEELP